MARRLEHPAAFVQNNKSRFRRL